ncbi:MAG: SET domain-containing protein-lysine N-methyltransferase [Niastella sp. SCN 39-18]|nr:SET domain-containing protein-lysine N-methyltransferase [Sphingobacteriales bacterium]ODT52383.1 MAG: SET domain-containing protein-lysine N-methyltransferase [Niastella sp. SCN 39-18]OJW10345.1 MAG: SET domain-containing protein-lysine N-methyltransferase [Sphingobacteriales bacterium 39-19]
MQKTYLYIEQVPGKGRGVFTHCPIEANEIIETAPVIVMSGADRSHLDKTLLHDYIFEWGINKDQCAMALGYIPVYNHSYNSNCEYFMDFDNASMWVKTIKPVAAGEELTINYNGDFDNDKSIWFTTQ